MRRRMEPGFTRRSRVLNNSPTIFIKQRFITVRVMNWLRYSRSGRHLVDPDQISRISRVSNLVCNGIEAAERVLDPACEIVVLVRLDGLGEQWSTRERGSRLGEVDFGAELMQHPSRAFVVTRFSDVTALEMYPRQ